MLLGLCSFSVAAAPEGTAITDAAGFLAMDPAGTYYLANDITINEPYAQAFTGILDGNGKTVTVSQPMFADFGGKIKNLTIEGTITALAADAEIAIFAAQGARGAVAAAVLSGTEVVFENIKNNAAVSAIGNIPDSDDCAGGIVGLINLAGVSVKFINCENTAAITGLNQVGGIVGFVKGAASVEFEGCVNNGAIAETGTSAYCAGIVCRSDSEFTSFKACVNNATVSSGKDQAGGMLAYASKGSFVVDSCVNNGAIAPTAGKAAGIVANINCNDANGAKGYYVTITNCVNNGNITAGGDGNYAAGITSTVQNNLATTVTNCVNYGEINGTHDSGGIVGHTTQAIMRLAFCENFGKVTTTSDQYAGGIVGYAWGTKQEKYSAENFDYTNIVEFNINHADITGDLRSGGIVGSFGASNSRGIWLCQYNINLGNVTCNGTGTSESANCAGGIVGYAYSTGATACAYILNNLTIGNIENKGAEKGVAAYFLGYTNSINITKINGNVAIGNVSAATGNAIALGWNNNATAGFLECSGNLIPADCTLPHTYELGAKDKVYEVAASDMAKLVSGEYVYNLNQTAGKEVVYMTVNGTDFAPTLIADEEKVVVKNADGTFGNPVKEPETTEPAPETTEPPVSGETGDSFVVFAAIAAISVLGVAVVAKRREN
jgi:hypothetical protein